MKLENRVAIVTGASQGFGKAVAQAFANAGANLLICARNSDQLEQSRREIAATMRQGQQVLAQTCDVSNPQAVKGLVEMALECFGELQILVNNAGVYGPFGTIETVDWAEWQQAIEINLYGVVLACRAVLPHFRKQGYGKIINLSGGGATSPMPRFSAYAASKAGMLRFTETLAEEMRDSGVDVNAVAPGALDTRMLDQVLEAGPEKIGDAFYQKMLKVKQQGGTPLEKGESLCLFLASSLSDGITGKLISAVWDPWTTLPEHLDDLQGDVYTLRRIVPRDRGLDWGDDA